MKTCPDCNGDGVIEKGTDDEEQCPRCGGSGFVPDDKDDKNNGEVIRTVGLGQMSPRDKLAAHAMASGSAPRRSARSSPGMRRTPSGGR
jgi:RecJ-like exonuclease